MMSLFNWVASFFHKRTGVDHQSRPAEPSSVGIPLHERYPDILEWKKGDKFKTNASWTSRTQYDLISITSDGFVYAQFLGDKEKFRLNDAYTFTNVTLRNRRLSAELKNSTAYMTLLSDFQKAVQELERRDTEKFGEPIYNLLDKAARS